MTHLNDNFSILVDYWKTVMQSHTKKYSLQGRKVSSNSLPKFFLWYKQFLIFQKPQKRLASYWEYVCSLLFVSVVFERETKRNGRMKKNRNFISTFLRCFCVAGWPVAKMWKMLLSRFSNFVWTTRNTFLLWFLNTNDYFPTF